MEGKVKRFTYGDASESFYSSSFLCINQMNLLVNSIRNIIKCDAIEWCDHKVNEACTYYIIKIVRGKFFYTITIFEKELTTKDMKFTELLYHVLNVLIKDISREIINLLEE